MEEAKGVIYILTNPSFPEYVKIGYADDVKRRLKELNRSECTPFAFRLKSIPEIDKQLYKKYNLTQEEIDFIESKVKPME